VLSSKSRTKIILSLQVLIAAIQYWKHPGPVVLIQADEDTSPSTSVRSQMMEMLDELVGRKCQHAVYGLRLRASESHSLSSAPSDDLDHNHKKIVHWLTVRRPSGLFPLRTGRQPSKRAFTLRDILPLSETMLGEPLRSFPGPHFCAPSGCTQVRQVAFDIETRNLVRRRRHWIFGLLNLF
jgi:hypothetical protein